MNTAPPFCQVDSMTTTRVMDGSRGRMEGWDRGTERSLGYSSSVVEGSYEGRGAVEGATAADREDELDGARISAGHSVPLPSPPLRLMKRQLEGLSTQACTDVLLCTLSWWWCRLRRTQERDGQLMSGNAAAADGVQSAHRGQWVTTRGVGCARCGLHVERDREDDGGEADVRGHYGAQVLWAVQAHPDSSTPS